MSVANWGLCAFVCAGFAGTMEAAERKCGEFASETLKVAGTTRESRLVVPKTVDLSKPAPLLVAFHGMLIDSKDLMPRSGVGHMWGTKADIDETIWQFFAEHPRGNK